MTDRWSRMIAELAPRVEADPGHEAFSLLAESYRRSGRLAEAERVARRGLAQSPGSGPGLAVLILALLDAERDIEARVELEERAAAAFSTWGREKAEEEPARPREPAEALSASELDRAFDAAEPEFDVMVTPDRLAEEAALRVDVGFDGTPEAGLPAESSHADFLEPGGAFSTRTMAELLEQQGDAESAARIRAALGPAPPGVSIDPAAGRDARVLAALERWLENVRRVSA